MSDADDDRLIFLGAGPFAALVLGAALTPVRESVTSSWVAYPFIILTMIAAEFGGRRAALATAVTSVLSMDFFLMTPYLRIEVAEKHDLITLVGFTACGIVAAALSSRRRRGPG
ncbi:MAG TPA: DUF4118 domain-containing protein [Candidatus Polarisedimenticolaceae bacterium]|nr:DUF4118 domain-containing protein [Candidatus Polarisedimenticolaceae bacterium]